LCGISFHTTARSKGVDNINEKQRMTDCNTVTI